MSLLLAVFFFLFLCSSTLAPTKWQAAAAAAVSSSSDRKAKPSAAIVTLRDEEDFAAFYAEADLGFVVYTSTNCHSCAHVISTLRGVVRRVMKHDKDHAVVHHPSPSSASPSSPPRSSPSAIPIARIVNDITMPELDELYAKPPHNSPAVPSIGVVRGGRLVPRRWKAGVTDAAKMEALLRELLIPDALPVRSVADAKRLLPTPEGFTPPPVRQSSSSSSSSSFGQAERIVVLGLFPVPSPLESELRDAAEYLRGTPNITVAVSRDAAVARYFGRLDTEASIGAFHEMRAGLPPHWLRDAERRAHQECESDILTSETDQCSGGRFVTRVSVNEFVRWHARPWVAATVDTAQQNLLPGLGGELQVSLVTSHRNASRALDGLGRTLRNRLGERVIVAVGWPPEESHAESMLPWGMTIGSLRQAALQNGVVLGGITVGAQRQYASPRWLLTTATVADVLDAVDDVRQNRIRPYVRSEPLPAIAPKKAGPLAAAAASPSLVTIVGASFEELVVKSDKHSLVLFVGSDCETSADCLMLFTIFNDLADVFRSDETLTVAVINGDENDMPHAFKARNSFPEIAFVNHYVGAVPEWYALELTFEHLWRFAAQRLLSWQGAGTPIPTPKRSGALLESEAPSKTKNGNQKKRRGHKGVKPPAVRR